MTDFCMVNCYIESLFIKISNDTMPLVIGLVFCPPNSNIVQLTENFNYILGLVSHMPCYIMSDYTVDLLKHDLHPVTENFLEAMYSNSLLPTIFEPTRETATIATLIDNVFTNKYSIKDIIVRCIFATDIVKHRVKSLFWVHIQAQSSALRTLTKYLRWSLNFSSPHISIWSSISAPWGVYSHSPAAWRHGIHICPRMYTFSPGTRDAM